MSSERTRERDRTSSRIWSDAPPNAAPKIVSLEVPGFRGGLIASALDLTTNPVPPYVVRPARRAGREGRSSAVCAFCAFPPIRRGGTCPLAIEQRP